MRRLSIILGLILLLTGCSVGRFVPEGEYLLDRVSIHSDSAELKVSPLQGYIRQHPNNRWFSLARVPLLPYMISGTDSTKRINRFLWRIGEKPVIYDSLQANRCLRDLTAAVRNMGYLDAEVQLQTSIRKKCIGINFQIDPGQRYSVRHVTADIQDSTLLPLFQDAQSETRLHDGMDFDLNVMDVERSRLNNLYLNNGYYRFSKDYIRFEADTAIGGNHEADLTLIIDKFRPAAHQPLRSHQQYTLGQISVHCDSTYTCLRPKVLDRANFLRTGELFSEQNLQQTYSSFGSYPALMSTNVQFHPEPTDSSILNADILVVPNRPHSINMELEGTNSAGDLGAAVSVGYSNRNLFHGSEHFTLKARGAFEAIKGLDGYDDQNYIEYSVEGRLAFPGFMFPFLSETFRRNSHATSEVSVMFDSQDRPEFHRRVLTGTWRYRWSKYRNRMQHRFDLLDLNYVFMPWISQTFKNDYLDDPNSRNAILRYNYENLFIMKWGYTFSYSSVAPGLTSSYGTNAYSIRLNVESSGNLLYGLSQLTRAKQNDEGRYNIFNIAYAQYVKGDLDYSKSFRFDDLNSLALHFALGIAYPYGNSTILPYEKRYFSGGANSVRGWSVRGLGPGSFKGTDGRIDFINQTGDMKLDMSMEYRTHLFWKVDGAAFVDAGNIWTLRNYADQPGGQFRFDTFWRQIAVAYGIGFRLNFDYFILRLDGGMKAINPAYEDARHHYPIIHPNFGRDFTFHFAVGLPF